MKIYVRQQQTSFEVSQTSLTVGPQGGEASFSLWCDKGWRVESDQDWCVIAESDKSGFDTTSKGKKITFTVPDILTEGFTGTRNAVITVQKPSTGESLKIKVEQTSIMEVELDDFVMDHNEHTWTFKLWCTANWTVESDQSWCKILSSHKSGGDTGENGQFITFYVPYYQNTKSVPRIAHIIVKATPADGSPVTLTINVTQQ